ncbi:hypothetical protein E5288_WYG013232 [Bos mutus]|uniref:ADP-ribosylation factor-like protein 8B n=1 Tax=Bos mutus TaxID=72004 RepID=A0A6B0RMY6_9CETA|nr:hypothetical protein [Bos mutus]
MLALISRLLDWFRSLFWKEEMELTLVGLQYSGKTTFVNVIAPNKFQRYNLVTLGVHNSCSFIHCPKIIVSATHDLEFVLSEGQFIFDMLFKKTAFFFTVLFEILLLRFVYLDLKIWDIGGQPRFRSMWERYCRGVNAIVYMIDAADREKIEASRNELHNLLDKPQLQGIPVLVLGNKRDLPNALDEKQLIEKMNLSAIQDREICCYSISCKEKDNIDITLQWLIQHSKSRRS